LPSNFDLQQFLSARTVYDIFIGSAFVTMVINITWFVLSSLMRHGIRIANRRIRSHSFDLGRAVSREEYNNFTNDISGFYCLIVRYGTDEYLSKLASDQERFEGRQQLAIRSISMRFDEKGNAIFSLKLPIHKRLGTQFKCFVEVRNLDKVPDVLAMLNNCDHTSDVKQSDSFHRNRIYFLLDQFFVVDTITAGVKNNFIFPE
jgi:hypothetical protein